MTNQQPAPSEKSLKTQLVKGVGWATGMRWAIKILGFVSTAILARLLTPEDYGLVAIALVLIAFTQVFFELGVEMALLRDDKTTDADFNTAWTIRFLQALALLIFLPLIAPFAADFYNEPRLTDIFYLSAIAIFIKGFENIGIVKFRKELQFHLDFKFNVQAKLLGVCVTIGLAFYFQSYFALIVGTLCQNVINVVLSYIVVNYRPRFTLEKWHTVWGFSKWLLVKNISNYCLQKGDLLILSKVSPVSFIGFYRWTQELNGMVSSELLQPISRVLLPGLSSIQSEKERLYSVYVKSLNTIVTIAIPVVLGLGGVATEFVPILLGGGDKWIMVAYLLEIAVFVAFFRILHSLSNNLLIILGYVKHTANFDLVKAIVVLSAVYPAYLAMGLYGVFYLKVLASFVTVCFFYYLVTRSTSITIVTMIQAVWRPCIAGLSMIVALWEITPLLPLPLYFLFPIKIMIGGAVYVTILLTLWLVSGKPESFESIAINKISTFIRKFA